MWGILHTEKDGAPLRSVVQTSPGNYSAYYDNIAESILKGVSPIVKPQDSIQVMKIIMAAKQSHELRKTIVL